MAENETPRETSHLAKLSIPSPPPPLPQTHPHPQAWTLVSFGGYQDI